MTTPCKACLLLVTALAGAWTVQAQLRTPPTQPVKLCMIAGAPHVTSINPNMPDGTTFPGSQLSSQLQGFSVDQVDVVFNQILQWNTTVTYYKGFSSVLYKTKKGVVCDVAVSALFISAKRDFCDSSCQDPDPSKLPSDDSGWEQYVCCLDFSHTIFNSGWALLSMINTGGAIDYIGTIFSPDIVSSICVVVIACFFFAHLIWFIEKREAPKIMAAGVFSDRECFEPAYLDGLRDAVWFASNSALNGVVASEKQIFSGPGRLVTTLWVLFGILTIIFATANISSTLITNQLNAVQISSIDQVQGKVLCTAAGFYEFFFTKVAFPQSTAKLVLVPDIQDCLPLVRSGAAIAAFSTREEVIAQFSAGLGLGQLVSPAVYAQQYAIAWREAWPYASQVNAAMLMYKEGRIATTPAYKDSVARWYIGSAQEATYGGAAIPQVQPWNWALIGTAIALVGTYMLLQVLVGVGHWLVASSVRPEELLPGSASNAPGSKSRTASMRSKSFLVSTALALSQGHAGGVQTDSAALATELALGGAGGRSMTNRGQSVADVHSRIKALVASLEQTLGHSHADVAFTATLSPKQLKK